MRALHKLRRQRLLSIGILAVLGLVALWFYGRGEQAADWQGRTLQMR